MRIKPWLVLTLVTFACGGGSGDPTAPAVETPAPNLSNCQSFPAGFVPFVRVYSTVDATRGSDRMVLGEMAPGALDLVRTQLPMPRLAKEQYCDPVALGPGLTVKAFVPTVAEREGDYSAFSGVIVDPASSVPFPNNVIPADRLGGLFAWHVPGG